MGRLLPSVCKALGSIARHTIVTLAPSKQSTPDKTSRGFSGVSHHGAQTMFMGSWRPSSTSLKVAKKPLPFSLTLTKEYNLYGG